MSDQNDKKVVPLPPPRQRPPLDPKLEEIRQLLQEATPLGDDLSDEVVIRDRPSFRRRFGPGFDWSPSHREALIRLIHEKGLTDIEVKLFRHTGNLIRTPFGVHLGAKRWMAVIGVFQITLFASIFAVTLGVVWPYLFALTDKALKGWVLIAGLAALCYALYLTFILPWRIQRRTEQQT